MSGTTGSGTSICAQCKGPKESTRMKSGRCRACDRGSKGAVRASRTPLRTDLPAEVWTRLAAEAAEHNQAIGRYVSDLITARDAKRQAPK